MEQKEDLIIAGVERWYFENCDGDWEHSYGVSITTMDNPGWDVKIDIRETVLSDMQICEEYEGERTPTEHLPANWYDARFDWYKIWVEKDMFRAYCSPKRLGFVLERFLSYMRKAENRLGSLYPED